MSIVNGQWSIVNEVGESGGREMLPVVVLPFHDPNGLYLPHLERMTPVLKGLFGCAFLSISPGTEQKQGAWVEWLRGDGFFRLNFNEVGSTAGDHYRAAYRSAVAGCEAGRVLHLCDVDKVLFLLQSEYREAFVADVQGAGDGELPLLLQRSEAAWATYPRHYREIEHLAIRVGEYLFGRYVDVAWSHLVIRAGQLERILPNLHSRDFGILAEVVLQLHPELATKEVDWLVWEDPFIYGRDAEALRLERDGSGEETRKRLRWLRPVLDVLLASVGE